ncbi:large ribosomal subunit protein uL22m isoform X4 [Pseudorca crassidens]|uniref:large ribosomal subunit protein uL22m isoform X4 n=2 Tax=Pseudorca crassidens TaxID=82174 RepID=UPI00352BD87E
MAAAILDRLGALWMQNLRGKLALGHFSSHSVLPQSHIHTSASLEISRKWEKKNKIVYPPQLPGEPRRPAEIYHCRRQIKYSKDKMWYLAKLIRGMSIDQALAQLEFSDKKGAQIIKEVLLEAQDMAVRDHNVEFRSNLYIGKRDEYPQEDEVSDHNTSGILSLYLLNFPDKNRLRFLLKIQIPRPHHRLTESETPGEKPGSVHFRARPVPETHPIPRQRSLWDYGEGFLPLFCEVGGRPSTST